MTAINNGKRHLLLRLYQEPISKFALERDFAILALAPNGGKTEVSIDVLGKYLKLNPTHRVLVLTHSTLDIQENYLDRLNQFILDFAYSVNFNPNTQVHVTLPQSIKQIKGKYDFLIVDEAHENYLAPQVQEIIKKIKPTKQLLLTGTPARFIRRGTKYTDNMYTLAINAMPQDDFAKLSIELVASNYDFSGEYKTSVELNSDFQFKLGQTKVTLDMIIEKLIERVKYKQKPETFNKPNYFVRKIKELGLNDMFSNLGKTIFACNDINQSNQVYEILKDRGVNVVLSNSKNDPKGENVKAFKRNQYKVLVVVNRARLGYSDNSLVNLIDMTGTMDPNIINQMFSRVLRGKQTDEKYYLKVTSQHKGLMDYTHAVVCGALMLTDNKYLSTFNGHNFKGMIIPIVKSSRKCKSGNSSSGSTKKKVVKKLIFPEFTNDVIDTFRNIIHDLDKPTSIYKATTIGEVREIFLNLEKWTKEKCIEIARKCNSKKEFYEEYKNAYQAARKYQWLDECCEHMKSDIRPKGYWTKEKCIEEAKKYITRKEWKIKSSSSYSIAYQNNWLDECILNTNKRWTKESCIEEAKKYTTRTEWSKNSSGSYAFATLNNLVGECTKHMINARIKWTKEKCIEEAKKYGSITHWNSYSRSSYKVARENGWLNECCEHMIIK